MKDVRWIAAELDADAGPFASFRVARTVLAPTWISGGRPLAGQVAAAPVDGGPRFDAAARLCLGGGVGLWFHAGWHDQASLELFEAKVGTGQAVTHMLRKLDDQQPEENGDTISGVASTSEDWVLLLTVSREHRSFDATLRAGTEAIADSVVGRIRETR